ncbi:aminotransferase class I/II-fold pyridoxal phosphate-dependent enzyme [Leucobacter chromiireducens]|uniref:aminotransferase class I/II-fold pyridoxal phosphate-dependent enzyme n=1 Tax=Leucobacter chromiireducens TaxID=283877 RepID=UPI003F82033C
MQQARRTAGAGATALFGATAEEIAASVRAQLDAGSLVPGDALPPVRALAEQLGVNRNTALAAYRLLVSAGIAVTRRGGGTILLDPLAVLPEEGRAVEDARDRGALLRDVGHGNPDPALLPDPLSVRLAPAPPRVYGEATSDPGLAEWATKWIARDQSRPFALTVTSGAVDGVERLLAQALAPGDAVALEDPCFLTSISTVKQAGYRPLAVTVDEAGMRPDELRSALEAGARAVVCTPRAHNPTGVSLTEERAAELRAVLADFPHVLIIEDDHFALLSTARYATIVPSTHRRWALVRSLSKVLGPDLRVALVASDPLTAEQLALRISGGITWVSHLLQRVSLALLTAPGSDERTARASAHYAERASSFVAQLARVGLTGSGRDGLNVWVRTGAPAVDMLPRLRERGWLARGGHEFALGATFAAWVRLTVHALDDAEQARLADDLAWAAMGGVEFD